MSNSAVISEYEIPTEKSNEDGYIDPLGNELDNDGYSVLQNDTVKELPQQYINSDGHSQRTQSFVQPPACLNSLLIQIKETMVMEILPESIRYVLLNK